MNSKITVFCGFFRLSFIKKKNFSTKDAKEGIFEDEELNIIKSRFQNQNRLKK
ncbi:hypothetical protein TREAZ_0567 [Leadbettera azotonutricia ZAS-9]|uniref:Uncharacterized protein n=1 Tax=Leadbettera azotonutricia (strain ATCC BAA-888 / DSM 13862 / ZAS-9) TaxID=545695 RepID=F5YBL0_LEAAZ|nr:hypothetical protein TREAZ_0567 [Leadbettera azotonutricia ZAS-9]